MLSQVSKRETGSIRNSESLLGRLCGVHTELNCLLLLPACTIRTVCTADALR